TKQEYNYYDDRNNFMSNQLLELGLN
mgnify:CR=1